MDINRLFVAHSQESKGHALWLSIQGYKDSELALGFDYMSIDIQDSVYIAQKYLFSTG